MIRILVVEDDVITRLALQEDLLDWGAAVVAHHDAESALIQLQAKAFDAAIIDIALPRMRGDTLARECRRLYPEMGIVLATGLHEHEVRRLFESSPKIEVLEKPFEFHVLRERLERLGLTLGSR